MKTNGYRWNPPTFTPEELKRAREGRAEMIRKAAEGWDTSGEWQRAMGVTPLSDLKQAVKKNANSPLREAGRV